MNDIEGLIKEISELETNGNFYELEMGVKKSGCYAQYHFNSGLVGSSVLASSANLVSALIKLRKTLLESYMTPDYYAAKQKEVEQERLMKARKNAIEEIRDVVGNWCELQPCDLCSTALEDVIERYKKTL